MILFETLSQPYILLWLICAGFCSGILFDFTTTICFLCNNNKIVNLIFNCISTILSFFILFIVNLHVNYGQFRIYIFAVFFLFLLLERVTIGKFVAKALKWCYNSFVRVIGKIIKHERKKKIKKIDNNI